MEVMHEEVVGTSGCLASCCRLRTFPPFWGIERFATQSLNISFASHKHIGGGYAAVGAVLWLPSAALPINFLWLWPQWLGNGPREWWLASRIGQPTLPKASTPGMSEYSRVGLA